MLAYSSLSAASTNSLPAIANSGLVVCSLTAVYFAPALVAFFRRQQNRWFILVLNFLFGWTIVGWVICLAWAARAPAREPVAVVQTAPPIPAKPMRFFRPRSSTFITPPGPKNSENVPFQAEEVFPERHSPSFRMVLFRIAVAVISFTVIAGVTASQWK